MQATFIDQKKLVVGNCQMGTKKLLDWGDDLVGNSTCYMNRESGAQTPRIHISRGCGHKHACNSSTAVGGVRRAWGHQLSPGSERPCVKAGEK